MGMRCIAMKFYSEVAMEKAMTIQQVILRAYAGMLTWIEVAEKLGYSPRHLRRLRKTLKEHGFHDCLTRCGQSCRRDGCRLR